MVNNDPPCLRLIFSQGVGNSLLEFIAPTPAEVRSPWAAASVCVPDQRLRTWLLHRSRTAEPWEEEDVASERP